MSVKFDSECEWERKKMRGSSWFRSIKAQKANLKWEEREREKKKLPCHLSASLWKLIMDGSWRISPGSARHTCSVASVTLYLGITRLNNDFLRFLFASWLSSCGRADDDGIAPVVCERLKSPILCLCELTSLTPTLIIYHKFILNENISLSLLDERESSSDGKLLGARVMSVIWRKSFKL